MRFKEEKGADAHDPGEMIDRGLKLSWSQFPTARNEHRIRTENNLKLCGSNCGSKEF